MSQLLKTKKSVLKAMKDVEDDSQKRPGIVFLSGADIRDHVNENPSLFFKIESMYENQLSLTEKLPEKDVDHILETIAFDLISKLSKEELDKSELFFNHLTEDGFKNFNKSYVFVFARNN